MRVVRLDLDISVDGAEPRQARSSVGQALEIALNEYVRPLETVFQRRACAVARGDTQVSADSHVTLKENRVAVVGFDVAGDLGRLRVGRHYEGCILPDPHVSCDVDEAERAGCAGRYGDVTSILVTVRPPPISPEQLISLARAAVGPQSRVAANSKIVSTKRRRVLMTLSPPETIVSCYLHPGAIARA